MCYTLCENTHYWTSIYISVVSTRTVGRDICPKCGREGAIVIRRIGNREYIYFRHGKKWCYIGPLLNKEQLHNKTHVKFSQCTCNLTSLNIAMSNFITTTIAIVNDDSPELVYTFVFSISLRFLRRILLVSCISELFNVRIISNVTLC